MNVNNETRLDFFRLAMPCLLLLHINQLRDQALNQILLGRDASLNYKKSYFSGRFL